MEVDLNLRARLGGCYFFSLKANLQYIYLGITTPNDYSLLTLNPETKAELLDEPQCQKMCLRTCLIRIITGRILDSHACKFLPAEKTAIGEGWCQK